MYDFYLQLSLTTVNGKSLKRMLSTQQKELRTAEGKAVKRSDVAPIAQVFFRLSHRNKNGEALANSKQEKIIENLYLKVLNYMEHVEVIAYSSSYVPFYDSLADRGDELRSAKVSDMIKSAMKHRLPAEEEKKLVTEERGMISVSIPHFVPTRSRESSIIDDVQMIAIAKHLPPIVRMRDWDRLFQMDSDGISMQTFFNLVRKHQQTIIIVQDKAGFKFGAYISEAWKPQKYFYGTGESFLFTFRDGDDISVFRWSGANESIMYSSNDTLAVGGSNGKFGLSLRKDFLLGTSHPCETFNSELLSSEEEFIVVGFEGWGFSF